MSTEKVPPERAIKWTNPDGDGLYKITVTNTSKTDERTVEALLFASPAPLSYLLRRQHFVAAPIMQVAQGDRKRISGIFVRLCLQRHE